MTSPSSGDNGCKERLTCAEADWVVAYENFLIRGGPAPAAPSSEFSDEERKRLDDFRRTLDALHQAFERDRDDSSQWLGQTPHQLGDFRILHEIGRGGMGVVFEAEQITIGRKVALKMLPLVALLDQNRLERFKNEVRAAATLDHPHCVPVYAVGEERGVHFYAMKLIRGQSMATVINDLKRRFTLLGKKGPTSQKANALAAQPTSELETAPFIAAETLAAKESYGADFFVSCTSRRRDYYRRVAELGRQVADALQHAHAQGVVHRDIKPGNLLLDTGGKIWVTDFGLARIEADAGVTMTGDLLGTLRYMSPEQALGKRALMDHRVDIYSLGATLYELLTLQPAIQGDDRAQLLTQLAEGRPPAPRKIDLSIPIELDTIVRKAMETKPTQRYSTATELADDLRRYLAHTPILARRSTLVARTVNWIRRYPVPTALIAIVLLCISALFTGALWHAHRLSRELAVNKTLREAAETQQVQMRRAKYLADMRLANRALLDGYPRAAGRRLQQYLPPSPNAVERDFPWYYLWAAYQRSHRQFHGHSGVVTSLSIAKKAKLLISCGHDKTVRFFKIDDSTEVARITDFDGNVNAIALTSDEQLLCVGADSGVLVVWDISSVADGGAPKKTATLEGHTDDVLSLAVSSDDSRLASAGADDRILVWDLPTMTQVSSLEGHAGWVRGLDFSPDGKTLASISHDQHLIFWDLLRSTEVYRMKIAEARQLGLSVRFHPNGQFIVIGNSHGSLRMIRLDDYETIADLSGFNCWFRTLDFSDDGGLLVAAGNDPFIRLLRVDPQMNITAWRTLPGHQRQTWCVRLVDGQRTLLSCGVDGTAAVRDIVDSSAGGQPAIERISIYRESGELSRRRLTSSGGYAKVFLAGKHVARLIGAGEVDNPTEITSSPGGSIYGGAISSDGSWVGILQRDQIVLRKVEDSSQPMSVSMNPSNCDDLRSCKLALHPSKNEITVGARDGLLTMVRVPSSERLAEFRPFEDCRISDVLYTSDGRFVAACFCNLHVSEPAMVVAYSTDSLAEHGRIAGVERLLAVSRNDGRLALANRDQSIQVWDVDSRSTIVTMAGHGDRVISGDFSPDGKYLATTALSGSIKFWSTETGQLVLDVNHGLRLPHIVFGSDQCAYATDIEILSREPELDYQHHLVPLLETHSQDGLRLANETLFSRDEGK